MLTFLNVTPFLRSITAIQEPLSKEPQPHELLNDQLHALVTNLALTCANSCSFSFNYSLSPIQAPWPSVPTSVLPDLVPSNRWPCSCSSVRMELVATLVRTCQPCCCSGNYLLISKYGLLRDLFTSDLGAAWPNPVSFGFEPTHSI